MGPGGGLAGGSCTGFRELHDEEIPYHVVEIAPLPQMRARGAPAGSVPCGGGDSRWISRQVRHPLPSWRLCVTRWQTLRAHVTPPPVPQSRVGHGALDSIDSDTALWTRPGTYRKEWLPADDPVPVSSIARRVRV